MEIVIQAGGMPFGPNTLKERSLGGSETAALCLAQELRKRGHLVTIFCNLPMPPRADTIESGAQDEFGVRWVALEQFTQFITSTEVDLLIVSRNPRALSCAHQAKKAVLWCHDLLTYNGMGDFMNTAWNVDEIWVVSDFHKEQIHKVCGYPKDFIKVMPNGINKYDVLNVPRVDKKLLYSARPERGLEYLVRPGGIMEKLEDFTLDVTFYENYPEHMMQYYEYLWARCRELSNVNLIGPKKQKELRQMMRGSWAYAYPTAFEEVFCILAKECIDQQLPFITTKVAALPGTLGNCGTFVDTKKKDIGSDKFIEEYVAKVRWLWDNPSEYSKVQNRMKRAKVDTWADIAEKAEAHSKAKEPSDYSKAMTMFYNGDIVAAKHFLDTTEVTPGLCHLRAELHTRYPYLYGKTTFEDYYNDQVYEFEERKGVPERRDMVTLRGLNRYNEIAQQIRTSKPETVLEYGCAEGPIILGLAQDFPDIKFFGIDFVKSNIELCKKYAKKYKIKNVEFAVGSTDNWPEFPHEFDMGIIAEVLEHTEKPWEMTDALETKIKLGGRIVLTVPQGPWEWEGLIKDAEQFTYRAHIWHVDKWMLRTMYEDKKECTLSSLVEGQAPSGVTMGHLVMGFTADRVKAKEILPEDKIKNMRFRQTMSVAMIAMNDEDKILNCLNSFEKLTPQIQVALGPSKDNTRTYLQDWAEKHPWIELRIVDVPKIETRKFGFDDARNASIEGLEGDWILWIDCDEWLSGNVVQLYLRNNAFDSYAIHQHHFTCEPRGEPTQLDKPARLFRNNHGFVFYGKVHEHAEMGENGGPGFVMVLPNIDIGHMGYRNEATRFVRFNRNFPLLEWDREIYPNRRMGKYLWLRDLIQRMLFMQTQGNNIEARRLAEEAISFYEANCDDFGSVGGGFGNNQAIKYYSDAMKMVGRGLPIQVQLSVEGNNAAYEGIFESPDDALDLGKRALQEQFDKRQSGYWI